MVPNREMTMLEEFGNIIISTYFLADGNEFEDTNEEVVNVK